MAAPLASPAAVSAVSAVSAVERLAFVGDLHGAVVSGDGADVTGDASGLARCSRGGEGGPSGGAGLDEVEEARRAPLPGGALLAVVAELEFEGGGGDAGLLAEELLPRTLGAGALEGTGLVGLGAAVVEFPLIGMHCWPLLSRWCDGTWIRPGALRACCGGGGAIALTSRRACVVHGS